MPSSGMPPGSKGAPTASDAVKRCLQCAASFDGPGWRCGTCGWEPASQDGICVFAPELTSGDGRDADYPFGALMRAEAAHFWFRSRAALVGWAIASYFPRAQSFLEIGAGGGGVLAEIRRQRPDARLAGSDVLVHAVSRARDRVADADWMQMDARRIPFDAEFDVVGAFDVIEHIDEDDTALSEIHRAITPGGGVVITVPQHAWLWSAFDEASGHRRRYTRAELIVKLRRAGFKIARVTSFASFALPLMAVSRLAQRDVDLDRALAVPVTPVNQLLLAASWLERAAIRAGASLPAGGSLLAVATRS
jgi:SAM-dependent methyltransferase